MSHIPLQTENPKLQEMYVINRLTCIYYKIKPHQLFQGDSCIRMTDTQVTVLAVNSGFLFDL